MKIKISVPNDYNSEADLDQAINDCYSGDREAAENDGERECYEALAAVAKGAGLSFVAGTDFGAIWKGTPAQCAKARAALPEWAYVGDA